MVKLNQQIAAGTVSSDADDEVTQKITVYMPEAEHKALRLHTVAQGVSMNSLMLTLMRRYMTAPTAEQFDVLDEALGLPDKRKRTGADRARETLAPTAVGEAEQLRATRPARRRAG